MQSGKCYNNKQSCLLKFYKELSLVFFLIVIIIIYFNVISWNTDEGRQHYYNKLFMNSGLYDFHICAITVSNSSTD